MLRAALALLFLFLPACKGAPASTSSSSTPNQIVKPAGAGAAATATCTSNVGSHCTENRDCAQCADGAPGDGWTTVGCVHSVCTLTGFSVPLDRDAALPAGACTPNVGARCTSDQDCAQCADVNKRRGGPGHVRLMSAVDCIDAVCTKTGCPFERCPRGQVCNGCAAMCSCGPAK